MDIVAAIISRHDELYRDKATWNANFQDVVDYVLPRRQSFLGDRSQGQQVTLKIFDSTAPWANDQLASGLHSFLTSGTARWFLLKLPEHLEADLSDDEDVRQWLEIVTNTMYGVFNSQKSNFGPQAHELYLDLGAFGTGVMYVEEDYSESPVRFCTYHLGECLLGENAYGLVDEFIRKYKLSASKAREYYGDNLPPKIMEASEKRPGDMFEFIHCIRPRFDWDPISKSVKGKPYGSWHIAVEERKIVREGGFHEFPIMAPRWSKLTGETYGRGPGLLAMPDIKMVNAMAKTIINAAQKVVDPPLMLPDEGFLLPIRTTPGGLNFYSSTLSPEQRIIPLETKGRVDIGLELLESRRQHITRSFYLDNMQLQQGPQMTATEVVQRTEEKMRLMAPAITRLQSEFLDPLIDRVFAILMRKGYFPPVPQALQDKEVNLRVEYVSPVAKAQQMTRVVGFQRLLESLGQIAQAKPEVFDRIDADGTVDFFADAYDVSFKTLTPMNNVKKIRDERNKAMEDERTAALANSASGTALNVSKAMEGANGQPTQ